MSLGRGDLRGQRCGAIQPRKRQQVTAVVNDGDAHCPGVGLRLGFSGGQDAFDVFGREMAWSSWS